MNKLEFGKILRNIREKSGLSQKQLAAKVGVSAASVSLYELHERMPNLETLANIAIEFKVTTDYLLGIEKRRVLDISGLDEEEITIVENLVESMRKKNKKIKRF